MEFVDQQGSKIQLNSFPKRIISLVPSQTELLFDLGLNQEIIGITKFCIHPNEKVKSKEKIGGTKNLNLEKILFLQPDLIIGNKEENEKYQIEFLQSRFPVWMSDIVTLEDSYEMIHQVGLITNTPIQAKKLISTIKNNFNSFSPIIKSTNHQITQSIAYLIWQNPYMCAGSNTFVNTILELIGFKNVFANKTSRYPETTTEELKQLQPNYIFLSSEPFPFKEKHIQELQKICPQAKIMLVDGEAFSWYGSRLQHTPKYLQNLLSEIG